MNSRLDIYEEGYIVKENIYGGLYSMFALKTLLPFIGFAATQPPAQLDHKVINHVSLMSELKGYFDKKKSAQIKQKHTDETPTLSYLKAAKTILNDDMRALLAERQKAYPKLVEKVIEREKAYCKDNYVFYHSQQRNFSVLQDFIKEFYTLMNINKPLEEFAYLRMQHQTEKSINTNSFLNKLTGWWIHYTKSMMCVNLSLFGNIDYNLEDSFWYFENGHNCQPPEITSLLEEFCDHFGLDKKYAAQISDLASDIYTKEGHMVQIFIPKDKVDEYVYLSEPGCAPYTVKIDDATYDTAKQRHTKISPILDKYIGKLSAINNPVSLQARVLFSHDFMLNPESGVKIFRYTTASPEAMDHYRQKVKQLAQIVFAEAIEKNTVKNIKGSRLDKLLGFIKTN